MANKTDECQACRYNYYGDDDAPCVVCNDADRFKDVIKQEVFIDDEKTE